MICWQMGKTSHKAKIPPGYFKVTTSKNSLINNQAITSIRNLTTTLAYPKISTYNWTFASIPNWTWSCSELLRFVQISNLWLTPLHGSSTWLTLVTWLIVVSCKILHFINNKYQNALGYKILWRTNAVASLKENKSLDLCIHMWWLLK